MLLLCITIAMYNNCITKQGEIFMGDIRQTNFRIGTETAKAFRSFCEENGMNQAQGFDYLMEVLALDKARNAIPKRETEIANFEQHTKAIISLYLHSLELNENAEARARDQFVSRLEAQSITLAEYQKEISNLRSELAKTQEAEQALQQDYLRLQDDLLSAEEAKRNISADMSELKENVGNQIADKDNIISMLTVELAKVQAKASDYDALSERKAQLQADLALARQTIKDNQKDAQIALERAVRDTEKTVEAACKNEIEKLRSQNVELLQTITTNEREANDVIRILEAEKASLREELAALKGKGQSEIE